MNSIKRTFAYVFVLLASSVLLGPFNVALATYKPATLYKSTYKVAVTTKTKADKLFSLGWKLYTGKTLGSQVVSDFSVRLSSSMTSAQTSIPVTSMVTKDGHTLTMSDFGGQVYLTIEPGGAKEEIIRCTNISGNSFTSCTRGLAFFGTSTSAVLGNSKTHSAGVSVIASNVHYVYQGYVDTDTTQTITGLKSFTATPTLANNVVTKGYVDNRNGYWEGSVANFAALPTGNTNGETRVTLDDSKIYVWNGSSWILAGSGGGAGTVYVDTFQGSSSSDHMTFIMSSGSFPDKKFLSVYVNGTLMEEGSGADYVASSSLNAIKFNSAVGDTDKVSLIVQSISYYNPAWGSVDANLVPTINNSFDLGSSTRAFRNVYASGTLSVSGQLTVNSTSTLSTTTFSVFPTTPNSMPTASTSVANKGYVDIITNTVNGTSFLNLSSPSGATTSIIHNLGRTPKFLRIYGTTNVVNGNLSQGSYNGNTYSSIWYQTGSNENSSTYIIKCSANSTDFLTGAVTTFNSSQIIITWTKTGSPGASLCYLAWEVY